MAIQTSTVFDEPDSVRKLALEVEDRTFWVPRDTLAAYSLVFKAMLYGDFVEGGKDRIQLPEKKAADIQELLLCLIPMPVVKSIDYPNVELMLKFSDEYQIGELVRRAEIFLTTYLKACGAGTMGLLFVLRMGSKYRMKGLLEECVERCGKEFNVEQLKPIFQHLRSEVIACLMMYSATTPFKSKCLYFYEPCYSRRGNPSYCQEHFPKVHICMKCKYCQAYRCATCFTDGKYETSVCTGSPYLSTDVRSLLDRM